MENLAWMRWLAIPLAMSAIFWQSLKLGSASALARSKHHEERRAMIQIVLTTVLALAVMTLLTLLVFRFVEIVVVRLAIPLTPLAIGVTVGYRSAASSSSGTFD